MSIRVLVFIIQPKGVLMYSVEYKNHFQLYQLSVGKENLHLMIADLERNGFVITKIQEIKCGTS